jgi:hypothetical protein
MGWSDVTDWVAGLVFIYAGMFGVGKLILDGWGIGLVYLTVAAAAGFVIYRHSTADTTAHAEGQRTLET